MQLQESGEMYLETIFVLSKTHSAVRSVDVSEHMGFSKPSVSRAVSLLKENGYLEVSPQGYLTLTEQGIDVAQKIYERHTVLSACLIRLGVDPVVARQDACKMEHAISDESLEAIKKFVEMA